MVGLVGWDALKIRQQKHPCSCDSERPLKYRGRILGTSAGNSSRKQVKNLKPSHGIFNTKKLEL